MRQLNRWFDDNPVDLAYVSMLKHDAYTAVGAGERLGFPVILRPEGAGATGDIAWQSWGNFGKIIGYRCRRATAFVAISQAVEDELLRWWDHGRVQSAGWRRTESTMQQVPQIMAIPNGVPIPEVAWQPRPAWQSTPRAVFVGRLANEKGLDTLISAWPVVRAKYPRACLTLLGEGPHRPLLEAQVKTIGMTLGRHQAVDLAGTASDPTEVLRQADLFILPSREEGMSIALLEAMALGVPVVCSSISGNRRVVEDFRHGRLAPVDDCSGLARVIIDQWNNFDRAVDMGRAARSHVAQEFSIQVIARRHMRLFQDIVAEYRCRR
jgi:glycosyltransferase involved in cell wall biosynthesis